MVVVGIIVVVVVVVVVVVATAGKSIREFNKFRLEPNSKFNVCTEARTSNICE